MKRTIAIHQPEHLPWLGFFHKMKLADKYIVFDNIKYKKNFFENRNKIYSYNGVQWITVNVLSKGLSNQKINEVNLNNAIKWRNRYVGRIKNAYCKTPYFKDLFPVLQRIIQNDYEKLIDLNIELINFVRDYLSINNEIVLASSILSNKNLKGSDLVMQLCKDAKADYYISGISGKDYLSLEKFQDEGIKVLFQKFTHPIYKQLGHSNFQPYLSIVDLMFNHGPSSLDIIEKFN
jgi:hypothetical protein